MYLLIFPTKNLITFLLFLKQGEDGSGAVPTGSGFEFGIDPNEDPELALALRVSMEEQRARQEATTGAAGGGEGPAAEAGTPTGAGADAEDDPVLARALAMSVGGGSATPSAAAPAGGAEPNLSAMTEDEQIAYAMRMSMAEDDSAGPAGGEAEEKMDVDDQSQDKNEDDYSEAMNDPAFLQV